MPYPLKPEMIIVESIILIPKSFLFPSKAVHCIHYEDKVLQELGGHVLINGVIVEGQLQGNVKHHHTVESHPGSPISLLQDPSSWQWFGTIKDTCPSGVYRSFIGWIWFYTHQCCQGPRNHQQKYFYPVGPSCSPTYTQQSNSTRCYL